MKKLESTWYNMALVLTIISLVAGAALGYVNELTKGPIEEIKAQQLADGIKKVLNAQDLKVEEPKTTEDGTVLYLTDKGTAIQASDANAFSGNLTVLVGFDTQGIIMGYQVLETAETPGLGAKAATWFQTGGKGCIIGANPAEKNLTVKKDGGEVDAITASTITSRAFLRCVNKAYAALTGVYTDGASGATKKSDNK